MGRPTPTPIVALDACEGNGGADRLTADAPVGPGAAQGQSKSSQIRVESGKARPNLSQGNAWISFAESSPFQRLAPTPQGIFSFSSPFPVAAAEASLSGAPSVERPSHDLKDALARELFLAGDFVIGVRPRAGVRECACAARPAPCASSRLFFRLTTVSPPISASHNRPDDTASSSKAGMISDTLGNRK